MPVRRVPMSGKPRSFTSHPDRIARVTLAILDGAEPVVYAIGHGRTGVIVWPGSADGSVDVQAALSGAADALPWDLSRAEVDALRRLVAAGWDFRRYDLLVTGGADAPVLTPTPWSLRESESAPCLSPADVERLALGEAA